MRALCCLLLSTLLLCGKDNTLSKPEADDGWVLLFDGASFFGWNQAPAGLWRVSNGVLTFDGQRDSLLGTVAPFSDFQLRFEFRSGGHPPSLVLRYPAGDSPVADGYAVPLSDGSIASVGTSQLTSLAPNQWHAVNVECSGENLTVSIDGRKTAAGKDQRSKAGYLGFSAKAGDSVQLRNVRLKPLLDQSLFNGNDLSNWSAVGPPPPKPAGGLKKMLKLGSSKPKEAQWTVQGKSIHGQGGSGELQSQSLHSDFVLQFQARLNAHEKTTANSLRLRADAAKFATGYSIALDAAQPGSLVGFTPSLQSAAAGANALITVAVAGRHFIVWVNGYPATQFDDTRPEAPSIEKGAKSSGGAISFSTDAALDVASIRVVDLPKALGKQKAAPAVATAVPPVAQPTPASIPPMANPAMPGAAAGPPQPVGPTPEQQEEVKTKAQVKQLTGQALAETDPQRQMDLYGEILKLDPESAFAANGYRDSKAKIDAAVEQQNKQSQQQAADTARTTANQAKGQDELQRAENDFTSGKLREANSHLAAAERLIPANPQVSKLRNAIDAALQSRQRLKLMAGGAGVAIGALLLLLLLLRKRGNKTPVLIVAEGFEKGKQFLLNSEVNHIGAVQQDGTARNEIVLRDVDRMISRFHCEILHKNGKLFLRDCGSSNGTFVNGKRLQPKKAVRLTSGSRVNLGKVCDLRVGWQRSA